MVQPCSSCLNEHLTVELTDFQGEKLCAECLAEKRTSPLKKVLLSPLGIAALVAVVVPLGLHYTQESSVTENGVLVAGHFRDFVAIGAGGLAVVLALVLGVRGRGPTGLRWGVALALVLAGAYHLVRGFGLDRSQPQAVVAQVAPPAEVACANETPGGCEKPCDGGDGDACNTLGAALVEGLGGLEKDVARSVAVFEKGCAAREARACGNAGQVLASRGGPGDEARALELWKKGCELGHGRSCNEVGAFLDNAKGADADPVAARGMFQKACEAKSAEGCKNLAILLKTGRGGERDEARALGLYQQACEAGQPEACNSLALSYQEGQGVAQDEAKAVELYEKACTGELPRGCTNLAEMLNAGQGTPKDPTRARELLERACTNDFARACDVLGLLFLTDRGPGRDEARGVALFQKACDGGFMNSCVNLGLCYRDGTGVERDLDRTVAAFTKGCDAHNGKSCALLGLQLASTDPVRARPLLKEACEARFDQTCAALKGLGKKKVATAKRKKR
ncbi:tetratricopeptide repeat protein [Corallococcus llansteffanensis]|uniref:Sel1 repeat family protein n=1 Tax=Corallococcus llansteffanensis TaxID=2316731 RepID=A0A3A8PUW7_9BACT|nr:SEL1-like repeat protein [Corallococcus llansteffanensis]RKH60246.1 sel1 repeat family protein [Corallococcus llansteffanensis]